MTEGDYNILQPSVYLSMRQKMNDDSLYFRAVSSTQHEGGLVSFSKYWGRECVFVAN